MSAERRHILLLEIARLKTILIEDRLDFLSKRYIPLIKAALDQHKLTFDPHSPQYYDLIRQVFQRRQAARQPTAENENGLFAEVIFDLIVNTDPDPHKKNTQWLLNVILRGGSLLEDLDKANQYLTTFGRVKHLMPVEQRDLNKYKTFADLFTAIEPFEREMSKRESDRALDLSMHGQARVIFNDDKYKILIPLTREAACHFGMNTQWCTAATRSQNFFEEYNRESPLFIVLDKINNRRFQYHFSSGQLADENDRMVSISTFASTYPEIVQAINENLPKPIAWVHSESYPSASKNGQFPLYRSYNGWLYAKLGDTMQTAQYTVLRLSVNDNVFQGSQPTKNTIGVQPAEMARILNELKIKGDPKGETSDNMYNLYYRNNRWVSMLEAARPILTTKDGWQWKAISFTSESKSAQTGNRGTGKHLILVPKKFDSLWRDAMNKGYVCEAYLSGGVFSVLDTPTWPVQRRGVRDHNRDKGLEEIGSHIVDLLLKLDGVKDWGGTGNFYGSWQLGQADAARLIDAKPFLGDLRTVYKAKGNSPIVRRMVLKKLAEEGIDHKGKWLGKQKDKLVVLEWKNIEDCMDDIGTKEGKDFYEFYVGDDPKIEYYPESLHDSNIEEFLEFLEKKHPDMLKKLGEFLAERHQEIIDDEYGFDPTSTGDIKQLLNDSDDDDILQPMRNAVASGLESGAQSEGYETFKRAVDENPYLWFAGKGKKRVWKGKMELWDAPVIFAVPLSDLVELVEDDMYTLYQEGWVEALGDEAKLDPQAPYHGFTKYDEDYACERFLEDLHDILNPSASYWNREGDEYVQRNKHTGEVMNRRKIEDNK